MNEPTTPDHESTWPRRYPLDVDLDVDAHSRAQQRLRELLISQPWYQEQDKCFGMDFWRALLRLILTDPATKTRDGRPIVPPPIQQAAHDSARWPPAAHRRVGWTPAPDWPDWAAALKADLKAQLTETQIYRAKR